MNLNREDLAKRSLEIMNRLQEKEFRKLKDEFQYHPNMLVVEKAINDAINKGEFNTYIPTDKLENSNEFMQYLLRISDLNIDIRFNISGDNLLYISWYPKW